MNEITNQLIEQLEALKTTVDAFGGILNNPNLDPKAHQLFTNSTIDTALASLYDTIDCGEVNELIKQLKQI